MEEGASLSECWAQWAAGVGTAEACEEEVFAAVSRVQAADVAATAAAAAAAAAAEAAAAADVEPAADGAAAMDVEPAADGAAAAPTTAPPPSFRAEICACLPAALQEQLAALEAANMAGFERNGEPFAAYFNRWDLKVHVMTLASGEVAGFAISGAEGRGQSAKVFLYELHVADAHRGRGYASALLELVESSGTARTGSAKMVELNVHEANANARGFYARVGFVESGTTSGGAVLVMRRRR